MKGVYPWGNLVPRLRLTSAKLRPGANHGVMRPENVGRDSGVFMMLIRATAPVFGFSGPNALGLCCVGGKCLGMVLGQV